MSLITLRVLDGPDRGRAFQEVPTPLTIGREDGNPIQLNDDRISRFHLKIQVDDGKMVLTDLESTNGTRVNGETVQLWVLRPGDVIMLGRTVLLYGSTAEIAQRLAALRNADLADGITLDADDLEPSGSAQLDVELQGDAAIGNESALRTLMPPDLPDSLSPGQSAQIAEVFQFLHLRLRRLVESVKMKPKSERVSLEAAQWQRMLDLHDRVAGYLRRLGEPREP